MFVRWLGAFGSCTSLTKSTEWETCQKDRQVAAEPLIRGRSTIYNSYIGLLVDAEQSLFIKGFLYDAWTKAERGSGILKKGRGKGIKNIDKFKSLISKKTTGEHHGEAIFDLPVYSAVVFDRRLYRESWDATAQEENELYRKAERLANKMDLPLKILK